MNFQKHFWFCLLLISFQINQICSRIELTNLKCISMDKDMFEFEYCILKSINQTFKILSGKLRVLRFPIRKIKINFGLHQLVNGYKPFLFNVTVDYCKFWKNRKATPVAKYFYNLLKDFTNFNHSCPFNHDFIVDNFSIDLVNYRLPKILPFPEGTYMIETYWTANDEHTVLTKLYFKL